MCIRDRVCYLLLYGELPTEAQAEEWVHHITFHTYVHENIARFMQGFRYDAHPMGTLVSTVAALSTFYPEAKEINDPHNRLIQTIRLIAKMPTSAAMAHKYAIGQPFVYPRNDLNYSENFLHMLFAVPCQDYEINPIQAKAMDRILILHADHEQNCSASTVRVVGSSMANVYASVASGILALWGPLHGGANQQVLRMLERIHADGDDLDKYVRLAKDPDSDFRMMGFGHRVYKNFDPRATIIKGSCDRVLNLLGVDDPLLDLARRLEEVALSDEYFIERKLYPNVDFYSGIIYRAIGIPENMFTVMFALGRLPGWIAQWKEMHQDPKTKIARPRQIYNGETARDYVPIENRVAG